MKEELELWPEQLLAAAVVQRAVVDARAGGEDAREWLRHRALPWLEFLCSDEIEPEEVVRQLVDMNDRRSQ